MEWIKKLKISQKLTTLIAFGVIMLIISGFVGYYYNMKACNDMTKFYNGAFLPAQGLAEAKSAVLSNASETYEYEYSSPAKRAELKEAIIGRYDLINKNIKQYEEHGLDIEESRDLEALKKAVADCKQFRMRTIALFDAGKNAEADKGIVANEPKLEAVLAQLDEMNQMAAKEADSINTQNDKDAAFSTSFLLIILVLSIIILSVLGTMISNMITRPIKQAIDSLSVGTDEVSAAGSQVAAASQALAEGTSEQAASVQETSSTLEETSSMVHQNRENTQQASVLAKQARQYAEKSNTEMGKLSTSMTDLKSSSNEISKIIKVIDEIAFQTNILSLNAAVEAARAGDAGKGFAVVAEEVRNLAQRSAQAAKDTAVIIEGNVNLSISSFDIAKAVKESVVAIEEQAGKVSDLLEEISVATNEQAQGVEQINKAVSQMEIVLHTNAQTAEEAASASQALSEQAINVKEIVNTLIVLVDGAEALRGHPQSQMAMSGNPQRRISSGQRPQTRPNARIITMSQSPESIIPLNDF